MHLCKTAPSQKSTLFRDRILFYYLLAISFISLSLSLAVQWTFLMLIALNTPHLRSRVYYYYYYIFVCIFTVPITLLTFILWLSGVGVGDVLMLRRVKWMLGGCRAVTSSKVPCAARTHIISHFSTLWRVHATARASTRVSYRLVIVDAVSLAHFVSPSCFGCFGCSGTTPKMRRSTLRTSNNTIKLVYIIYNNMYMHIYIFTVAVAIHSNGVRTGLHLGQRIQ